MNGDRISHNDCYWKGYNKTTNIQYLFIKNTTEEAAVIVNVFQMFLLSI